ncbi:MAG: toxin-antitoxin system protein [Pyrinomonadaceae bacterium]
MSSTTVRAKAETHRKLRRLASETGQSISDVLSASVDLYERERVLDRTNEAFAALRLDEEGWRREQEERDLWEGTLADDFEPAAPADS